jgi:cold shock CspA family protein
MASGTVKGFNATKGFGFIAPPERAGRASAEAVRAA